ncbi:MAG: IclR family transcriptional regulator [Acetobacteraceae bacterium]|nr:IclR family transcriptional regulator [Acetobacteraceae bacterium]
MQAVVLTLRILEFLAQQRSPTGVTSLSQALGTTKSRIFRHLRTLAQQGYIVQDADSERYRIGVQMVRLGRLVGESFDLMSVAQPILRELRDTLGHSTVIAQAEMEGVRVLARLSGKSPIEIQVKPGSLLAHHSSAQGKIALAFGEEELRTQVLRSRLDMYTPYTISQPAALEEEIERTRQRGWAVAPNEALVGLNALAAPVFDATGALAGTVAIVDSIQFIAAEPSEQQIRLTTAAAQRISEGLGHSKI